MRPGCYPYGARERLCKASRFCLDCRTVSGTLEATAPSPPSEVADIIAKLRSRKDKDNKGWAHELRKELRWPEACSLAQIFSAGLHY